MKLKTFFSANINFGAISNYQASVLPHTSAKPESLKDSTYGVGANPTRVIHTNGAVVLDCRRRNENSKADNPMLFAGSRVQEKPQLAQGVCMH